MTGKKIVILLGPPGVGKGTQGRRLAEERDWRYLATGDVLREGVKVRPALAEAVKSYMDRGELVPDAFVNELVEALLESSDQPVVLDGYPRTLSQAEALDQMTEKIGWQVHSAILMKVNEEELVDRLTARRVCPQCGEIYNLKTQPPQQDDICDRCGQVLIVRDDDKAEVIRRRLSVYQQLTEPVVEYYRRQGRLTEVDASGSPQEVYAKLWQVTINQ
ncbi:MAG: adenylate kinase [Armatimonadetes bacterium]|nr:adenylate kinase [Armatimonadota bacterium]MDW8121180.1 adenylate kinase [Armatimonadota bacterium]